MSSSEKGKWIRRIFTLGLVLVAAGIGLYFAMPGGWLGGEERAVFKMERVYFAKTLASKNKLTVLNMMVDGNLESKKLDQLIGKTDPEVRGMQWVQQGQDMNKIKPAGSDRPSQKL